MSFLTLKEFGPIQQSFAAAVGRALVVCQHLEDCAHHVMVSWAVTDEPYNGPEDLERIRDIAQGLRNVGLGAGLRRLENASDFAAEHAEVLQTGRQARNWLVHDALKLIEFGWETHLGSRIAEFNARIVHLCEADALASRASYEICERRPVPVESVKRYHRELVRWIMDPLLGFVDEMAEGSR